MYDIKIYEDGREKETVRELTMAQASTVQRILDRHDIKHTVKRLTMRAGDVCNCGTELHHYEDCNVAKYCQITTQRG